MLEKNSVFKFSDGETVAGEGVTSPSRAVGAERGKPRSNADTVVRTAVLRSAAATVTVRTSETIRSVSGLLFRVHGRGARNVPATGAFNASLFVLPRLLPEEVAEVSRRCLPRSWQRHGGRGKDVGDDCIRSSSLCHTPFRLTTGRKGRY